MYQISIRHALYDIEEKLNDLSFDALLVSFDATTPLPQVVRTQITLLIGP